MTNCDTIYTSEFDDYPEIKGQVTVEYSNGDHKLYLILRDKKIPILIAYRDQWGVYYMVCNEIMVSQEDSTRSFIDALINGLQEMRQQCEFDTRDSTIGKIKHDKT